MWCAASILSVDRDNAKFILSHYRLDPHPNPYVQYEIALRCHRLSLIDDYWIKTDDESLEWKDINLRDNWYSEDLFNIALFGSISKLKAIDIYTPELTTGGSYPKAWKREGEEIRLYKSGETSKIEVEVSGILGHFNVNRLEYRYDANVNDACYCNCMSNESCSIVSAAEAVSYCKNMDISFADFLNDALFAEDFYKMLQVDYLISNIDRHLRNWGFFMDNATGDLLGLHPLFDHNLAFYKELMIDPDIESEVMRDLTYVQVAKLGHEKYPLVLTRPMTIRDDMEYSTLLERMDILGIRYAREGSQIYPVSI